VAQGPPERPGWQVRISPAVLGSDGVFVEANVPSGGGVWVGGRWVLTCAHVIGPGPGPVMVRFSFAAGEPIPAAVAPEGWLAEQHGDLALLALDRDPPPAARPAPLRPARAMTGHPCAAYGYPRGLNDGVWSEPEITGQTADRLQLTARAVQGHQIERGFSGTGLFDTESGAVVGLVVTRDKGKDVLGGFAIPLQAMVAAFPQLGPWAGWRLGTDPHLRQHWRPRARGVYQDTTPGWHFTGRTALLRELTGWLEHGSAGRAVRVVTGPAGTGKSAALAWLCALSDPQLRAEIATARPPASASAAAVPAAGRVKAAVWARGLDANGAAGALAAALTLPVAAGAPVEDVLAAVGDLDPPERGGLVVVLDALDEARAPRDIARQLLVPLARDLGVKVLAGTRPGRDEELVAAFGERAVTYRLDDSAWFDRQDLADYAAACLRADFDPDLASGYRTDPAACEQVAAAIAEAAGSNFLVAGLAARARADEPVIDVSAPGWRALQRFPADVGQAFDDYLARFGDNETRARDLLRAVAYAEGTGLPAGELWADMATALAAPRRYDTDDLAWLRDSAAGYLVESGGEHGLPVYRIFHQALIEYLRPEQKEIRRQRELVEALRRAVPPGAAGPDWAHAPSYVRRHLAAHAAAAGLLDDLLGEAGFLATAEPGRLLAALAEATTERGRQIAQIVERVGQQLLQAPPGEQVCYLEMAARMASDDPLAKDLAEFAPQRPWSVPWARWEPLDQGRLLGHHNDYVVGVSAVDTEDGTIVVSASAQSIRAWSLAEGSLVASGIGESSSPITAMVAFADSGDTVVLTLHDNGDLRRTTLGAAFPPLTLARDLAPSGPDLAESGLWLISHDGQPAVVTINRNRMTEILSAADGHPVGLPAISVGEGRLLTVTSAGQRVLGAIATPDDAPGIGPDEVAIWDLNTGAIVGTPFRPERHFPDRKPQPVWAAALTERDKHVVMLGGSGGGGPVFVWDPIRDQVIGEEYFGLAVFSVLITHTGDGELQCWGDSHGNLYLRSGDDGAIRRVAAHDSGIEVLGACQLDGKPSVITGGRDGAVRVWHPSTALPTQPSMGTARMVVVPSNSSHDALVAAIRQDGTVPVLDAANGKILSHLMPAPDVRFQDITLVPGKAPAVLTVDSENHIAVWRPPKALPELAWQLPPDIQVGSIAVADGDRATLLIAQANGQLAFFDIASGQPTREPLACTNAAVSFTVAANPEQVIGSLRFTTTTWLEEDAREWTVSGDKVTCLTLPTPDPGHGDRHAPVALAFARLDNRHIIVGVGGFSCLRVWDAQDGSLIANTLLEQAHHMELDDVDVAEIAGRLLVLCGGYTCTLALWPLDTRDEHHLRVGSPLWYVKSLPGDRVLVAGPRGIMTFQLTAHLPGRRA
jgi:WD40 repeat protein